MKKYKEYDADQIKRQLGVLTFYICRGAFDRWGDNHEHFVKILTALKTLEQLLVPADPPVKPVEPPAKPGDKT